MPTPTPEVVQLAFPVVAAEYQPAMAAAVLRAIVFLFCMVLMHVLYSLSGEFRHREQLQLTEDFLVLMLFSVFQFILILLPERADLQAAAFTCWFFLFFVRSLLRSVITMQE